MIKEWNNKSEISRSHSNQTTIDDVKKAHKNKQKARNNCFRIKISRIIKLKLVNKKELPESGSSGDGVWWREAMSEAISPDFHCRFIGQRAGSLCEVTRKIIALYSVILLKEIRDTKVDAQSHRNYYRPFLKHHFNIFISFHYYYYCYYY